MEGRLSTGRTQEAAAGALRQEAEGRTEGVGDASLASVVPTSSV